MTTLRMVLFALLMVPMAQGWADSSVAASELQRAERMIATCLAYAAEHELPPLAVVVVDASGAVVALKRQDGAMPASSEVALVKARTSIRTRAPTAALQSLAQADPATRDALQSLQLMALAGGVPFAVDATTVGAIGVSGASAEQDAACASAALAAAAQG